MSVRERFAYWLLALASWALPPNHPAALSIINAAGDIAEPQSEGPTP